ncbi:MULTISPECIES: C40 family peptidase [Kosmotoga]|uniref:NlpC/P60 domain-containing protein n=1 Tax=Kosmotoga olearia (strain ATCC BAA-1733 / DSM 21960 / TBF 19.5.1) TaxID=521045 RepID=C5CH68_KOSOT|nr:MULTISPECIES: C40 family peptidase [Kosmotoga]ACR80671.1 hypothetical protein Kole_1991 [Kosmotoga olearia TBF 19.5.1]MDI3495362.1 hypothetical protein [Pseudothermotoga sp.]OAA19119.1 hypothetical protein DU53_10870 [Kosmotoga sp. DU53]
MKKYIMLLLMLAMFTLSFPMALPEIPMTELERDIINTALSMLGGTYGWGEMDPEKRTFDCWNFVTWVFHEVLDKKEGGVKHMLIGHPDPLWVYFDDINDLRTADVLMNGGGHTVGFHSGIYYGRGFTIEARGGQYGIGIFRLEGFNKHAPFGETGYRFCYYSLLARLWLNPHPSFPYVYMDSPDSFVYYEDGANLKIHYLAFPFNAGSRIKVSVVDYITHETLKEVYIDDIAIFSYKEQVIDVHVDLEGITSSYVYFKVTLLSPSGEPVFKYDTFILYPTEIV